MEPDRVAAFLGALSVALSRRHSRRLLSGLGVTAILGHASAHAKPKRKKKKKKKGTVCLTGQTLIVPKSAVASLLAQGATAGACPPVSPPPFCQGKPDLTGCGTGQLCSGGSCAVTPTCKGPTSISNCFADDECCSGICDQLDCTPASAGQGCLLDVDCLGGNQCVGFVCQPF